MPWEVDDIIPADLWIVLDGYRQRVLEGWKQTREICYRIFEAATNRDLKKAMPSREKMMPLPGDDTAMKERAKRRKEEYLATKERHKQMGVN